MHQAIYSGQEWESWGLAARPVIPEGMPVLIDDDLLFEDAGIPRPTVAVNRWLRELPANGAPGPKTWRYYAQILREWMAFLTERGVSLFGERPPLKAALSAYAVHRSCGPLEARFEATTWNQHMSVLSGFYRWAVAEGYAVAEPFTYKQAQTSYGDLAQVQQTNQARRRTPKPHVMIKYLEADFAELFLKALAGLAPDGTEDVSYRGRELERNAAVGRLALSTGLRRQEFTHLLAVEIPALPRKRSPLPVPFPLPAGVTKGRKFRTTWVDYDALAEVHRYLRLTRPLAADGSPWQPPKSWGSRWSSPGQMPEAGGSTVSESPGVSCGKPNAAAWWRPTAVRCCWLYVRTAVRSPPGPRSSPAPPSGSANASSRDSRTFIPIGSVTPSRSGPLNSWSAATTRRRPGW